MEKRIDLHTHSTASDGSVSPRDLVFMAKDAGLSAMALTDHDTTAGNSEALAAGEEAGVRVIPGCELSVKSPTAGAMHILGLWLPENPAKLTETLDYLQSARQRRNEAMVEKLTSLGLDVSLAEVLERAGGTVGRPHVAQVLVDKGYVRDFQEAFDKYLGGQGVAHVPKVKLAADQAVRLIKNEGGTAILAHPYLVRLEGRALEAEVRSLKLAGLDGIEAHYSEHTPEQTRAYLEMAERVGLVVSGGSDFHGKPKPEVSLGIGKGDLFVPESVLTALEDYRRSQGLWV